jgi:hypothetical protein
MPFVAVYDACVLYPAPIRDLLLRIANSGIVRARWTERILDECFRSIGDRRPDLAAESLRRTRRLMCDAIPDCIVVDYERMESILDLPDVDDRHVLAAAIRTNAQAIVTFNLRDFPATVLARFDIEANHPDDFVLKCIDLDPGAMSECVINQALALKQPLVTVQELLDTLSRLRLAQSAARLRELLS